MGEVYRARDTRLDRDVAVKIVSETFAHDQERLARFQREAKTLALLNHPNIGGIYGLEEASGVTALVLELVEGSTLADRIARGPIPLDEALPLAKQIAEALEAAHEQGIVHRDLKPANIKVREDGTVKVLDFGLAKALEGELPAADMSMSPTLSVAGTRMGVILGTAAYMAPEQARGKTVDRRADIWAFGCVLYEMLAGRGAFHGDDVSMTLAAVMMKDPDWGALPTTVPSALRRLVRTCLEKDPKRRLQAAGDARLEIDRILSGAPEEASTPAVAVAPPPWRGALPWGLASMLGAAFVTVLVLWAPWRNAAPSAPVRLETAIGADASIVNLTASLAVSADGSTLAFAAQNSQGAQELYVRRLDELRATPLTSTAGARNPFFSPDGQWIGFFADGKVKRIAVTGGAAVTLADAADDRGGAWAEDGSIIFQPATAGSGLLRVSSAGGATEMLTDLEAGQFTHRWPQVLPGGDAIMYTAHTSVTAFDDAVVVVQPIPVGVPRVVQRGGYYGRYLPSGHLVYMHKGTLFAVPFDLQRLAPTGQAVPVIEGVRAYSGGSGGGSAGSAHVAWTNDGVAIYVAGQDGPDESPLQWMDRTGNVTGLRVAPTAWGNPHFSPDGRRLAIDIRTGQTDVFVYEWARDTLTRVTFAAAEDMKPIWTPDGRRLAFRSSRDGSFNLYWQRADGSGDVQRLTESQNLQTPASWHPSGKFLAFFETRQTTGQDLMVLPLEGDETSGWKPGKPTVFLSTPFNETEPIFSPDGRWIAYQSQESGRFEVYVRPFPGPGGRWQVSTDGGITPVWSRTRPEIFYANSDNRLMVTSYRAEGDVFATDKPKQWVDRRFILRPGFISFALHPDGERFALAAAPDNESALRQDKLVFIFNFFDELRRLAPAN
jgi:Tol biopolymer transport system component